MLRQQNEISLEFEAPKKGSQEEMDWFLTSVYWHLVMGGPLGDRSMEMISEARENESGRKAVQVGLERLTSKEAITEEAAGKIRAHILGTK